MQSIDEDNSSPSIDLKTAINSAHEFLMDKKDTMGRGFSDIRLEEVELSNDRRQWLITLGYNLIISREEAGSNLGSKLGISSAVIADMIPDTVKRYYRIFKVNARTGEVESMKIRNV
jgi:hypothetical protein